MRSLLLFAFTLSAALLHAQGDFDIKDPSAHMQEKCSECLATLRSKPKEVQFGLFADADRTIWFVCTSELFLDQLITKSGDGIAVDVIPRDHYRCGTKPLPMMGLHKGTLLKPVYLNELKKTRKRNEGGSVAMKVGQLPAEMAGQEYELNLMVLKDHHLCYYNSFYDLAVYRWDLLNMGMYMDTLTYGSRADTARNARVSSILRRKVMHFTIPFQRNKAEYSAKDLQPLYDSLRLTDFTIKRIDIEAYSSVEGPEARNLELQEKRAQSIVNALQSFQRPSITTTVKASENWVEFLRDVALTGHADLAELPKADIKKRLLDKKLVDELEPILAFHRKAIISLELTRKDGFEGMTTDQLVTTFEKAISDKNLERARAVQNSIFARITDDELPSSFLDKLEVPAQREWAQLLNSRVAFKHFANPEDAYETYRALQELDRLLPNDPHIKYNLCAVKFRLWLLGGQTVDPTAFKKEIEGLRMYRIDEPLVKRMLVNFHIVMAELYMQQGAWAKKDECIKFIAHNYGSIPMQEQDYLSLAQYFSSFANYDEAIKVVKPRLANIDVDEDLLFYYLNLTIFDPEQTKQDEYRRVMLNAINKDKPRFCHLFDPFGKGGITFQLLDDAYLSKTYCETCP